MAKQPKAEQPVLDTMLADPATRARLEEMFSKIDDQCARGKKPSSDKILETLGAPRMDAVGNVNMKSEM